MDVKEFIPELRRMIQGPLQAVMADELFSSAIIFCKEAQVIREQLTAGDVSKGDKFALTSSDNGLTVWGVVGVFNDDGDLKRHTDYMQHSRNEITFTRDIKGVSVLVWLIPTDRKNMPEAIKPYGTEISHGAASSLYLQPDKQWTNGNLSAYHKRYFVEGYRNAYREQLEQFGTYQNPETHNSYWT